MFTIHVDTVYDLRLAVLPLATLCDEADIKCSREKLSIIVVPSYPFVASLRMLPTFFTSFQLHPHGDNHEEHRYNFLLQLFATNISNMYSEDLSMTIYIGGNQRLAPLKFEDPHTGYLQYSALVLSHPQNIDISPIDFGVFVAIRSTEFINIVSDLVILPDELVSITLTETEVKFGALTGEVIFTTENKDCIIGGVKEGKGYMPAIWSVIDIGIIPGEANVSFSLMNLYLWNMHIIMVAGSCGCIILAYSTLGLASRRVYRILCLICV